MYTHYVSVSCIIDFCIALQISLIAYEETTSPNHLPTRLSDSQANRKRGSCQYYMCKLMRARLTERKSESKRCIKADFW